MNGRVFGHSRLSVFWTAPTVPPPYWQNGGSSSPDLTATDRLLVPANAKDGSAARSPQTSRFLAEGIIGHARLLLPQPSLAVCVRRRCLKQPTIKSPAVAGGSFAPTLRFETLEIHKVCLRITNLDLAQNLSPSTLVNFIVGRLATERCLPTRHRTNHHN